MKNLLATTILLALLAACSEAPVEDTDPVTDPDEEPEAPVNGVPASVAGNMRAATYDADAGTLLVRIDQLDADIPLFGYTPDGSLTGYDRFYQQDDPLDRFFTAFAKESDDGSVVAVVAVDGGQFNRFFGGVTYTQNDYSAPDSGLASYAGDYVGLLNVGVPGRFTPAGTDPSMIPYESQQVTGKIFLNADFADNAVNGSIYDRVRATGAGDVDMETVILVVADIGSNGSFAGVVEDVENGGLGTYAGTFGGDDAAAVAGGLHLTGDFIDTIDNEQEYGIFVLNQCVAGTAEPGCFATEGVND